MLRESRACPRGRDEDATRELLPCNLGVSALYLANAGDVGEPVLEKLFEVSNSARLSAQLGSQHVDVGGVASGRRHR